MESGGYVAATVVEKQGPFPMWKKEGPTWTSCNLNSYNNSNTYHKPDTVSLTELSASGVGFHPPPQQQQQQQQLQQMMEIYGSPELMDLDSDFNGSNGIYIAGPIQPISEGFSQPLADQILNPLGIESNRNDLPPPNGNVNYDDTFDDIETDSSSGGVDEDFFNLRNLLVTNNVGQSQQLQQHQQIGLTRGRSLSDGVMQRPRRNLNDRRYSDAGVEHGSFTSGSSSKKARCFWQYNMQSKGPKRDVRPKKINLLRNASDDPHILKQPDDPVFDPVIACDTEWKGISVQHTGKARRGNGNDLTADPKKLCMIGFELDELNENIASVMTALDMQGGKQSARKEKNKLTSRVCRLKKKAQHEANKIKLQGLHQQHKELMRTLTEVRSVMSRKAASLTAGYAVSDSTPVTFMVKMIKEQNLRTSVCGRSLDYVNEQIEKSKDRHGKPLRPGMRQRI
ncbi:putative Protein CREBRF-like protein [Hypsibius exemplaris]|uniref:BZIP domain-containing protein n=1 Tax=Hypsibius exemplaris TaxID=2072580 RepID=A0A1W0XFK1_HYPEX|nr:putative Protein CREBRF-like protein [Hypsibius exemplaris]